MGGRRVVGQAVRRFVFSGLRSVCGLNDNMTSGMVYWLLGDAVVLVKGYKMVVSLHPEYNNLLLTL